MKKSCLCLALMLTPQAFAGDLVQWWDFSATTLYGEDYDLDPGTQATVTLETAGAWKYGDWFAFQDFIYFKGNHTGKDSTAYGELSPRFSASKILGEKIAFGPVTDVSLALTYEKGEGPIKSFLYGVGVDVAVPYFTYLNFNTYRRNGTSYGTETDGWQFTPVYRIDIPVGNANIVFDGFIDWVFATDKNQDGYKENFHFNPQIKYDLGKTLFGDHQANKLLVGIEYDLWTNKYGVKGVDQDTYSVIAQYHF
ncbi:ion channel protein Tsx [Shewanella sp. A25]|nr:ion channel protein Tsx [Shewanella shenzhenensis]